MTAFWAVLGMLWVLGVLGFVASEARKAHRGKKRVR